MSIYFLTRPYPEAPGDDQLHDLGGAGEDGRSAGVQEEAAEALLLHRAAAVVEPHGLVGHPIDYLHSESLAT